MLQKLISLLPLNGELWLELYEALQAVGELKGRESNMEKVLTDRDREDSRKDSPDELIDAISEVGPTDASVNTGNGSLGNDENKNDSFSSSPSSSGAPIYCRQTLSIFCLAWAKVCLQSDLPSMVETAHKKDHSSTYYVIPQGCLQIGLPVKRLQAERLPKKA